MRVLIIEDNPKMSSALENGLRQHGYATDATPHGFEGEEAAMSGKYDLILLDLMLADRDGVEVCRNLRRRGSRSKILMLTALSGIKDKIQGLDVGADDYLTKPFEFEELLARIRALLRRGDATEARTLRCDDLELDLYLRVAKRGTSSIELTSKEFGLLEYLMRNPNRVLSRAQICEKVWDLSFEPSSNVVDVYVSSLRRKLDHGHPRQLIHTVKGVGYQFGIMDET
jgi:DNA-binding response OmpR family regulator